MSAAPRAGASAYPAASGEHALCFDLLQSRNERDAAGFAAHFAAERQVVGLNGSEMGSPAEVAAALCPIIAQSPLASNVAKIRGIIILVPRVTLLRAIAGMVTPYRTGLNPTAARSGRRT